MSLPIPPILEAAHEFAAHVVNPGDAVVDATVGQGHDTVFLARTVGASGEVYGFDIQQAAVEETERRVVESGADASVHVFATGHETMRHVIPESDHGSVAVVMFNLGYLPGGDKTIITEPDTTIQGLNQAVELIRPGGRVTIVMYRGHPGGADECAAVREWAESLDQTSFRSLSYRFVNQINQPPSLVVVEKRTPDP